MRICIGKINCSVSYFRVLIINFLGGHELDKISTEHMEGLTLIGHMASLAGETN
jgi:hypothetical protein